ncbi:hypothetical protein [Bacillus toyonensis]|uniref:hypothetical protein n=1 Tax=Bacillus toyonensis TaxID=155322 RepID=UPI000BEBA132|nr:hypothetical protein [Bacillus toyonensis]PEC65621.1 hypothetical protein CON62_20650 [Bacillus toyonensis]
MKKRTRVEVYKAIYELVDLLNIPADERELDDKQKQYLVDTQEEERWRKHPELPLEISSWGRVYRPAFVDSGNSILEGKLLSLSANQQGVVGVNFKRDGKPTKRFTVRKLMKETF